MNNKPKELDISEIRFLTVRFLHCHSCGKRVSTGFIPLKTDTPDKGIIVRAWIECPECIEGKKETRSV